MYAIVSVQGQQFRVEPGNKLQVPLLEDEIGAETTLINEEFRVLLNNMRERKVTEVFRSSWNGDYNDAHTFLSIFESGSPWNLSGWSNAEYDSLMRRAPTKRRL